MNDHLATYLNNHLAGSVAALDLIAALEKAHRGAEREYFFKDLGSEIAVDRIELEAIMEKLQIGIRQLPKVAAWLGEKASELKLSFDDGLAGPLWTLQAVEAVALEIEGKRALWRSLAAAAGRAGPLYGPDYSNLARRADDQRRRVESVRLDAAREALAHP
jgi:hypothetical protein